MQPEAIAIRLPPLKVGPAELIGKTPVVVFAEQGMSGAQLDDGFSGETMPQPQRLQERFQLDDLVVILDRSESMQEPVSSSLPATKMDHIKDQLGKLRDDFFPETRISLITLNSHAEKVPVAPNGGVKGLQRAIASVSPTGNTKFDNALELAERELNQDPNRGPESRRAVIFITDGQDHGSKERAKQLAEAIRDRNTGTFLIGVGADYNLGNLFELASSFSFSGWAHTPTANGNNVFKLLLPAVLADMQSAEHYLQIRAEGSVAKFYGITPAVREAAQGVFYMGYQNEGMGICFVDADDPKLTLEIKSHVGDTQGTSQDIKILDPSEAAAQFEKLQLARGAVAPLLVLLSQLRGDASALAQIADEYPTVAPLISPLLADMSMGRAADAVTRMDARATMSELGTLMGTQMFTRANQHSMMPRDPVKGIPSPPNPAPSDPGLHSGGLGPLSMSPRTIGSMGSPNPDAYRHVQPRIGASLMIINNGRISEFDLGSVAMGNAAIAGRSPACEIFLSNSNVSRTHFLISHTDAGYEISDLKSKNGTKLNGAQLLAPATLKDGDVIQAGEATLTFRAA